MHIIKQTAQCLIIALLILSFFAGVYQDFNGRKAKEPGGFVGFVTTLVVMTAIVVIYCCAGLFSTFTE